MKSALVIAHPGHELRLSAWIGRERPDVFIIARGSRSGRSCARIEASAQVIAALGGRTGAPFGAAFDADLYAAIMASDPVPFLELADQLRHAFRSARTECVVADAWQNYNPVHDLTHLVARVAAAEVGAAFLDYPVVMGDLAQAPSYPPSRIVDLAPAETASKRDLVARFPDIAGDVAGLIDAVGREAAETETLHPSPPLTELIPNGPPWYESWGEARVREGVYAEALRWSHMAPIIAMLRERLETAGTGAQTS